MLRSLLVAFSLSLIVLIASTPLTGCNPEVCTLIGCEDGVSLRVVDPQGELVPTFTATITFDANSFSFRCPMASTGTVAPDVLCNDGGTAFVRLPALFETASVEVDSPAGRFEDSIRILYEDQFPNGESCGAACAVGTVQVEVE